MTPAEQAALLCAVCGDRIMPGQPKAQPYPPNGSWVHDDGPDGCCGRYWDAPGTPDPLEGDR